MLWRARPVPRPDPCEGLFGDVAKLDLTVNGAPHQAPKGSSVRDLIEALALRPALVVVELNFKILERDAYGTVLLEEGDRLELVHFVGGG